MEDEIEPSAEYIKSFNNGYLLAQYEKDLAAKLTGQQQSQDTDYAKGLAAGKQEYEKEMLDWAKSFIQGGKTNNAKNLSKDKDR